MTHILHRSHRWLATASNELSHGLPLLVVAPVASETDILVIILTVVLLVLCLGAHEAAHAWVAWKCGDPTAKDLGRITLNPLPHIDLFRTILLPAVLLLSGGPAFGGAKPVPVNFHRLRHPWRDMSLVAIAGPLMNFVLAIFFLIAWHFFVKTGFYNGAASGESLRQEDLLPTVLLSTFGLNVVLAVFNMLPIPPLDGSRVLTWMLPPPLRPAYTAIEPYGLFVVFFLLYKVPAFSRMLYSIEDGVGNALIGLVTLGGAW